MWIGLVAYKFTDGSIYDFYTAEQDLTSTTNDCGGLDGNVPESVSCDAPNPFICTIPYIEADYIGRLRARLRDLELSLT